MLFCFEDDLLSFQHKPMEEIATQNGRFVTVQVKAFAHRKIRNQMKSLTDPVFSCVREIGRNYVRPVAIIST